LCTTLASAGGRGRQGGEELIAELQPRLRFQSLAFVLPERSPNGGVARPDTWADDVGEILRFVHDTQPTIEVS
jgi:hypothetical protein